MFKSLLHALGFIGIGFAVTDLRSSETTLVSSAYLKTSPRRAETFRV